MKSLVALALCLFTGLAYAETRVAHSPDGSVVITIKDVTCPAYARTIFGLRQDAELFAAEVKSKDAVFVACWRASDNLQIRIYYAPGAVHEELPAALFKPQI